MKRINLKHIYINFRKNSLPAMIAVLLPLLTVACVSKSEDEPDPGKSDNKTHLVISTRSVDGARAGSSDNDKEIMHNLRVIILDSEGKVEINDYVRFDTPKDTYTKIYRVKPSENKTVYLIANETSIYNNSNSTTFSSELNSYTVGSTGIGNLIENKTFNMDLATPSPLPMSSKYEIQASEIIPDKKIEKDFYLVRTVCKFDVTFTNNRLTDLTFDNFSINNVAIGAGYLTAHLAKDAGFYKWAETNYVEPANRLGIKEGFGMSWINWLKIAVDESQQNPTDTDRADRRGWIMEYEIPAGANHKTQNLLTSNVSFDIKSGESKVFPTFYCFESKQKMETKSNFILDSNTFEQEYKFYLLLTDKDGISKEYNKKIPNLRSLFRNTHVVINIDITSNELVMEVRVVPYACIELKPGFGWDSLPDNDEKPDPDLNK